MRGRSKLRLGFGWLMVNAAIFGCARVDAPSEAVSTATTSAPGMEISAEVQTWVEVTSSTSTTTSAQTRAIDTYGQTLLAIASDIQRLGKKYPALGGFDPRRDVDLEWLRIHYSYKAPWSVVHHRMLQERRPVPEDDGLWVHIDFHERVEMNERASQVFRGDYRNHGRRIMVVIYAGKKAEPVRNALWRVLAKHGTTAHIGNP